MPKSKSPSIVEYLSKVPDPRLMRTRRHNLVDILVIALCALLCGAESFNAIYDYGLSKERWLRELLELPCGIPSHDTFCRVFGRIDPRSFTECFTNWVRAVQEQAEQNRKPPTANGKAIAIDGKRLRRSFDKILGVEGAHMVSAWSWHDKLVLGQLRTDADSNEITAIPRLLGMLDIEGCLITIDAIGTQKEIASQIVEQKGDYLLTLKRNQPELFEDVSSYLDTWIARKFRDEKDAIVEHDTYQTLDGDHGRVETRSYWSMPAPEWMNSKNEWVALNTIAAVEAQRTVDGKTSVHRRYYITSLPSGAKRIGHAIRNHWGIENQLHWVLDMTFREDECRVRRNNAPQNFATLRHIALNLIRTEKWQKRSIKRKQLLAGWSNDYLQQILFGEERYQENRNKQANR